MSNEAGLIRLENCENGQPCEVERPWEIKALLREAADEKPWVDFYRCSGCMKCKAVCVSGAIEEIAEPCDGRGGRGGDAGNVVRDA